MAPSETILSLTLVSLRENFDKLAAVIDWEFSYAAPTQFVLDPPWWLLFETPEMWKPGGVAEWSKAYEPQLEIWLKAMEDLEDGAAFLDELPCALSLIVCHKCLYQNLHMLWLLSVVCEAVRSQCRHCC